MKITEEEYQKAKAIVKEYENQNPVVRVGVLAYDPDDFLMFKQTFRAHGIINISTQRFASNNKIYYKILNERDLCGYVFDEIIETDAAKLRPDHDEMLTTMKLNLVE